MQIIKHLVEKSNIEVTKKAVKIAKKDKHEAATQYLEQMLPGKKNKRRKDGYEPIPKEKPTEQKGRMDKIYGYFK